MLQRAVFGLSVLAQFSSGLQSTGDAQPAVAQDAQNEAKLKAEQEAKQKAELEAKKKEEFEAKQKAELEGVKQCTRAHWSAFASHACKCLDAGKQDKNFVCRSRSQGYDCGSEGYSFRIFGEWCEDYVVLDKEVSAPAGICKAKLEDHNDECKVLVGEDCDKSGDKCDWFTAGATVFLSGLKDDQEGLNGKSVLVATVDRSTGAITVVVKGQDGEEEKNITVQKENISNVLPPDAQPQSPDDGKDNQNNGQVPAPTDPNKVQQDKETTTKEGGFWSWWTISLLVLAVGGVGVGAYFIFFRSTDSGDDETDDDVELDEERQG